MNGSHKLTWQIILSLASLARLFQKPQILVGPFIAEDARGPEKVARLALTKDMLVNPRLDGIRGMHGSSLARIRRMFAIKGEHFSPNSSNNIIGFQTSVSFQNFRKAAGQVRVMTLSRA